VPTHPADGDVDWAIASDKQGSTDGRGKHQTSPPNRLNNIRTMSSRLDKSWLVLASHQTDEANRCVDIFARPDGTSGFEEFRRDPEDMGVWTPVSYFSGREYSTESDVLAAARSAVSWLGPILDR
jgi:hypothetical protein